MLTGARIWRQGLLAGQGLFALSKEIETFKPQRTRRLREVRQQWRLVTFAPNDD